MSGKSQTIWDFTFSRLPRFCRLMTTRNRKYPRSSGMDGDKSGASRAFLFSRRVADFCDGRRSFPTNENSNLYRRGRRRNVGGGFRSLPIPRIVGLQSPYHASFNFWRTFHFLPNTSGESETELWRLSVRHIWDGWQKVKAPIVWDPPDIWKPDFSLALHWKGFPTLDKPNGFLAIFS